MGLLDQVTNMKMTYLKIHHDLMWTYGKTFASRFSMNGNMLATCDSHGIACCRTCFSCYSDIILHRNTKEWTRKIAISYTDLPSDRKKNLQLYLVDWLPLHLIKAQLLEKAYNMIMDDKFLVLRVSNGIKHGTLEIIHFSNDL